MLLSFSFYLERVNNHGALHPKKNLMRLLENTPTRKALNKFAEPARKSTGRPNTTWFTNTTKDIRENFNIQLRENMRQNLEILEHMCSDRQTWYGDVDSIMLTMLTKMQ